MMLHSEYLVREYMESRILLLPQQLMRLDQHQENPPEEDERIFNKWNMSKIIFFLKYA